ncbi:MAG: tetratricopeptide repeat protein [Chloroflexi bacterium]|nr:tetratricopeptide repeat protein [Chloroflexota bacterium]
MILSATHHDKNPWLPEGTINRPRLIAKLGSIAQKRLTLVSAPPGYGKTTLLQQFAIQSPLHVVWHTLEEKDRNFPDLYENSLRSLEPIAPGIHQALAAKNWVPSEAAVLTANYLSNQIARNFVYVLDDIQSIAGSPSAEQWLRTLVTALPNRCHLVLSSRFIPHLPLVDMIARHEVMAIGQNELRFTREEVQQLAIQVTGKRLTQPVLDNLDTRLEGWPSGVVMALRPLPEELERVLPEAKEGPEALFNALGAPLLETQSPDIRHFLMVSSVLDHLTPESCKQILGLPDAAVKLAEIHRRNLFLTQTVHGFSYHSLFRAFLQKRLQSQNPTLFNQMHIQAAQWFEAQDEIEYAFPHYLAADQLDDAISLAEQAAFSYFAAGKIETLLRWEAILHERQQFTPQLSYVCAMIYTDRYEYDSAFQRLDRCAEAFAAYENWDGLAKVQYQRAMIFQQRGNYDEAIAIATELLETATDPIGFRSLRLIGVARLQLGDVQEGISALEQALPAYRKDGDAYALSLVLQDLSVGYAQAGDLDQTNACLQEMVALRRDLGSFGALALAMNNLGWSYHIGSDYPHAESTFREGLNIAIQVADRRAESYLHCSLADLQRDRGAYSEAQQLYSKAIELMGNSEPQLRCMALLNSAHLERWQGNYHEALLWVQDAARIADQFKLGLHKRLATGAHWIVQAHLGHSADAIQNLQAVAEALATQEMYLEAMSMWGLCSHAALLDDAPDYALVCLQRAEALGTQMGTAQPVAVEIVHSSVMKPLVLDQPHTLELLAREVRQLEEAFIFNDDSTPEMAATLEQTFSLRVLTLGSERVERDGEEIAVSAWRSTTARELFLYLLFNGTASRETLSLVFWPDSSASRVRSNFHTTLHRARRALGENVIQFIEGDYQLNPAVRVWCDAIQLEQIVSRARALSPRDARSEDLWQKALRLYQGEFLQSMDAEWTSHLRERYQACYHETLAGLGRCAQARSHYREAIQYFRKALEHSPYREELHRLVMQCYADLEERQKIINYYDEMKAYFEETLAIDPSPETTAFYYHLLS